MCSQIINRKEISTNTEVWNFLFNFLRKYGFILKLNKTPEKVYHDTSKHLEMH